jgi:hypothetical protein
VSPSALGKVTDKKGPQVILLLSASQSGTRQRGSLCRVPPNTLGNGTGKGAHGELLCRVSVQRTLGKEEAFVECYSVGTRHRLRHLAPCTTGIRGFVECWILCRVPFVGHSAKKALSRAALDKVRLSAKSLFTECWTLGTGPYSAKTSLPSV